MSNRGTRKPVLDWDIGVFRTRMRDLGFDVEFIGKPETIVGLKARPGERFGRIEDLDEDSKGKIESYLEENGADGGLVVDKEVLPNGAGALTLAVYKLTRPPSTR